MRPGLRCWRRSLGAGRDAKPGCLVKQPSRPSNQRAVACPRGRVDGAIGPPARFGAHKDLSAANCASFADDLTNNTSGEAEAGSAGEQPAEE
jgi:hypothetical protein